MPGSENSRYPAHEEVTLSIGGVELGGYLNIPAGAPEVVVFAHGSGSSRHSPRNRHVASILHREGLGTLLFDLLTTVEELDRRNVFDIPLLGDRLGEAAEWVASRAPGLAVGYFGASTGAGAALRAAAAQPERVAAVVSRGGRPDLAGPLLPEVGAPTLLIVGGRDRQVLALNEEARAQMRCESELEVVPGATHLFEEPGALDQVADLASRWFRSHLPTAG